MLLDDFNPNIHCFLHLLHVILIVEHLLVLIIIAAMLRQVEQSLLQFECFLQVPCFLKDVKERGVELVSVLDVVMVSENPVRLISIVDKEKVIHDQDEDQDDRQLASH